MILFSVALADYVELTGGCRRSYVAAIIITRSITLSFVELAVDAVYSACL